MSATVFAKPGEGIAITRRGYLRLAVNCLVLIPRQHVPHDLLLGSPALLRRTGSPSMDRFARPMDVLAGERCELSGDGLGAREGKADQRHVLPPHDAVAVDDKYRPAQARTGH